MALAALIPIIRCSPRPAAGATTNEGLDMAMSYDCMAWEGLTQAQRHATSIQRFEAVDRTAFPPVSTLYGLPTWGATG